MALGDTDKILDSFQQKGIGNSGLAARAIQQSNIESLKSLRGAVNESQITMENQKQKIDSDFLAQYRESNRTGGVLRNGTRADSGGVFDKSAPSAFVNVYGDQEHPAMSMGRGQSGQSIRDEKGRAFRLTFAGGGNAADAKDFGSIGELLDYLKDPKFKGHQIRLSGTPSLLDENESNMLSGAGITPISTELAKDVVDSWPKVGFPVQFPMRIGGTVKDGAEAPVLKLQNPAERARKAAFGSANELLTSVGRGFRK